MTLKLLTRAATIAILVCGVASVCSSASAGSRYYYHSRSMYYPWAGQFPWDQPAYGQSRCHQRAAHVDLNLLAGANGLCVLLFDLRPHLWLSPRNLPILVGLVGRRPKSPSLFLQ